jgi:hypothetical protein
MAVVAAINKCSAKDHELVHFIRCLYLYSAFHKFNFSSVHIPGSHNKAADALSLQVITDFSSFIPQIQRIPVPTSIEELLLHKRPDWISDEWTRLFSLSLTEESLPAHHSHTPQA